MSKDTIKVNMNVYDIPILVEQLKKMEKENKQLKEKIDKVNTYIKDKKKFQQGCDTYQVIDWEYVLEILGDKENE